MEIIAQSTATAFINAAIEKINLTDWLFTLKEDEYRSCSKDHIAVGNGFTDDGRRTSLNVEQVAGNLLIQHYVEEVGNKSLCRVKSISDSFVHGNRTTPAVVWELKIERLTDSSCTFYNHVEVGFTDEFKAFLNIAGITDMEAVKSDMAVNLIAHNAEETPNFALNIEQKALLGVWK